LKQARLKSQTLVQVPQWFGLYWRSTHSVPHAVPPPGQVHFPNEQLCVAPQALPQAPQSLWFVLRSMQLPAAGVPQFVCPNGHAHAPFAQLVPPVQALLHAPQLSLSLVVFTHCPLQTFMPAPEQPVMHWPPLHESPDGHPWPQLPQFCASVCVFVQPTPSLQYVCPDPQTHLPPMQLAPVPHAWPQAPQFIALRFVLTHLPLQGSSPATHAHAPATQARRLPHASPHAPQFIESVFVSVQPPSQLVSPAPHAAPPLVLDVDEEDELDVLPPPVPPPTEYGGSAHAANSATAAESGRIPRAASDRIVRMV
jgi:hypothetical protein